MIDGSTNLNPHLSRRIVLALIITVAFATSNILLHVELSPAAQAAPSESSKGKKGGKPGSGENRSCTLYVAKIGSDRNKGKTPKKPLETAAAAVERARAGDVVCFAQGTYSPTEAGKAALHIDGKHGRPGKPITFQSLDSSNPATFSLGAPSAGGTIAAIFIQKSSHITIDGIIATNALRGLTGNGVHHVTVRNSLITNTGGELVYFGRSAGRVDLSNPISHTIQILNNEISHGGLNGRFGEGIYVGTSEPSARDDSHSVLIEGNTIHHLRNEAIDIKTGAHSIDIIGNTIHDIDLHSQAAITVAIHGYSWRGGDYEIRDNKITRVTRRTHEGVGIWVGHGNAVIEGNVIWDTADWGIYLPNTFNLSGHTAVDLRDNILWNTGQTSIEWGLPWTTVPESPATVSYDVSNQSWDGYRGAALLTSCPECTL